MRVLFVFVITAMAAWAQITTIAVPATQVVTPVSRVTQVAAVPVPVQIAHVSTAPVQVSHVPVAVPVVAAHAKFAYPPQPYHFAYTTVTEEGAHSHEETADGANRRQGSYTINIADGRRRIVKYVADEGGFRAAIETNELGTESNSPADVFFHSTAPTGPEAAIMAEAYPSRSVTGFPYYRKASAAA
ncbi:cuticle protein 16.8-like [Varroa jacobsoni]|uniref:Uncharacterized protein n=1 Tax=Varroa destructor TaxID=109461 RepID=A0A7M7KIG5_VARDE|nr:adult-specific rigid cuticular protein 15.7-like [Varroa destructor]XP_022699537.1 cuticle protein 16.8-like [Varroa jacobsoni]